MKVSAAALALALLAASQDPQAPKTTFKSAVDLVPVDVNVIDKTGRPVSDLIADDFSLTVDGKPRRIASAQFISVERAIETAPPKPMEYNSNAGADRRPAGDAGRSTPATSAPAAASRRSTRPSGSSAR